MTELEEVTLLARVAGMEEALADIGAVLRRWSLKRVQPDLLPTTESLVSSAGLVDLREALVGRFLSVTGKKYVFEGAKDAAAVKRMFKLKFELRGELMDRWEQCLRMPSYPGTQSLAIFVSRINSFGRKVEMTIAPTTGDLYGT